MSGLGLTMKYTPLFFNELEDMVEKLEKENQELQQKYEEAKKKSGFYLAPPGLRSWQDEAMELRDKVVKLTKENAGLKKEKAEWNTAWHEQRNATGKAWWQGYRAAFKRLGIKQVAGE
jgi:FtsZ-binding cell division protein ZapB